MMTTKRPPIACFAALLPWLGLALFYSFAWHMHRVFGGWPDRIGTEGFPRPLLRHSEAAASLFSVNLLALLIGLPVAVVAGASIPRLRSAHAAAWWFGVSFAVCFFLMQLAPAGFLRWWWD